MPSRPLVVEFVGDTASLEKAFGRASQKTKEFGSGFERVADGFNRTGVKLTQTLTPVGIGIAAVGKKAFDDWDAGLDGIRASTGATGEELDGLGEVMKNVAGRSTSSIAEIGETVADLHSRLGLTGKPLEQMTQRFADLQRLGMAADVGEVSRVFGDWAVRTEDQAAALDGLFRASQLTGQTIDGLSAGLVKFGAPMRQFGFSMEQTAALLGKFEKEGVNTNLVMGSMRIALGKMAKAGKDPVKGLQDVSAAIKNAGSAGEANKLAIETFGARAGPDMAAAIREGRFEIGDLFKQLEGGTDTIEKAAADTLDLGDKMTMLKNRVFGAIGPYGEFLALAGTGLAAIGPTLMGIGQLLPLLGKLSSLTKVATAMQWLFNAALLANPIGLVSVALVALGVGLVVLWRKSETFRAIVTGAFSGVASAFGKLADAGRAVLGFFRRNWKTIAVLISGPFAPLVALATDAFGIRSALQRAIGRIVAFVRRLPARLRALGSSFARAGAELARKIVSGVLNGLKSLPGKLKGILEGALKSGLGKLNPFSPVEHGAKLFIADPLISGAVDGLRSLGGELRSSLEAGLAGAVPALAVPAAPAVARSQPSEPAGRSRRGEKQTVVNIGTVYARDPTEAESSAATLGRAVSRR